ncbi:MAG: FemAB family protein [Methanoregula sp. PtaU1.Bin006]|uniref:GNAT family N-acetyltransferase n=1 Tax=Methanoregula sp. PtaU1.Bin006 TaxID=1811681 RepID=UPI0009CB6CF9|nr:GNAT family N-acetyltransferase [Methanoregula sp. PtaU1.Bin006]OPY37229.1 MAG: FemAB family protein [Methanoregula sp. PtaU1.Bin006]
MELHIADDTDQTKWDEIVIKSPQGTIFHSWKWLKILEMHAKAKLIPIIGYSGTTPIGILPLYLQKKGPLKLVFSPPPKSALLFLGPVLFNGESEKQNKKESNYFEFQKEIDDYIAREVNADHVSISFPPKMLDIRPYFWAGYKPDIFYDYVLPIPPNLDDLWLGLMKNMRGNINKSKKMGCLIELGGRSELEEIYQLMVQRYKDQNKNETIPKKYLFDLYDQFPENFKIFTVRYQDEVITGEIDLHFKGSLISWIGSPKPVKPISPSPNDLCEWEALVYAHSHGIEEYAIYGAARNRRLHKYYSKLNPELHPRFSVKKMSFVASSLEKIYSKIFKPLRFEI